MSERSGLIERLKRVFPSEEETPENRYFKLVVLVVAGVIVLTVFAGAVTFLFSLDRDFQISVPDLAGKELPDAILELQERELYPRLQVRPTEDPSERGYVIDQSPGPGAQIRARRHVNIVVSSGARVDEVEDYTGWDVDEVRLDVRALTGAGAPLLEIGNVQRIFDDAPRGTVLEQDPPPGADITGPTRLDLVVSRGEELEEFTLPDFVGVGYEEVMQQLATQDIPFRFDSVVAGIDDEPGRVIEQEPEGGTRVDSGTTVSLTTAEPEDLEEDEAFGVLSRTLPEYPIPVSLTLEVVTPEGATEQILEMVHPGGEIGIPYRVPVGSTLVLRRGEDTLVEQLVDS